MSLFITSLNSGSNGNCYYIGNSEEAVLVDAGISCREIEKRMKRLGLCMSVVKALFVSHEHSDHIKGVQTLVHKYQIPVYITGGTLSSGGLLLDKQYVFSFAPYAAVNIGSLSVTAFPKFHDASDPHSFIITCNGINVGVFTDIGSACPHVIKHFRMCHAAFLEANYDEDLLEKGRYPYFLKRRITGGYGHLSNRQALELFQAHKPAWMSHLLLSHLSKDNNDPQLVSGLFSACAGSTEIIIASRYEETGVYTISRSGSAQSKTSTPVIEAVRPFVPEVRAQLTLF